MEMLGSEDHAVGDDDLGLLLQDEHDGAARGHDREGQHRTR